MSSGTPQSTCSGVEWLLWVDAGFRSVLLLYLYIQPLVFAIALACTKLNRMLDQVFLLALAEYCSGRARTYCVSPLACISSLSVVPLLRYAGGP